ncbi:UNVERIFIED_CONTAM: protein ACTIVITY OF BC1 COMPLEX kinase, chloroplastic [Sesamum calycinum]|uniref:Protein ACTIVITY OF BC1 COMPLEX kinase, chloroplastic n=1 Tax=Sesamum calycinum TaxID=2727403 RepID=A0AAW2JI71_9LAMI
MCEVEEITVGYSVKYKRKSRNPNETSFEERLAAQRREREVATAELGFKKPLTKEEKIEKKKQRLAAIGEDLLAIAADQPFRFPATFTFVVRAFSVLDGIGKGLDPRFDITEIAKPTSGRDGTDNHKHFTIFRQADRVEKLAQTIQRLEQGDLKLRVGALESERAFQRVAAVQNTIGSVRKCFHGNREGVRHSQISLKLYRKMRFVPRGLLFAKFGSNLTAFFDLAFPICIDAHAPASSNAIAIDQRMLTTSNEFEKKLLAETHPPPGDIGITFDGIGAFGNVKETLKELVMLPRQRPILFWKGLLTKPPLVGEYCSLHLVVLVKLCLGKRRWCKVYINISMSSITSKSIASIYEAVQRRGNASMEIVRRVSGIYSLLLLSDILLMCMYAKQGFDKNDVHILLYQQRSFTCAFSHQSFLCSYRTPEESNESTLIHFPEILQYRGRSHGVNVPRIELDDFCIFATEAAGCALGRFSARIC